VDKRSLGREGLEVSALGYGAMVLEGYYGAVDEAQAVRTIQHALDAGVTLVDTADAYGGGHNEGLVGQAIAGRRGDVVVATKFGIVFDSAEKGTPLPTGWGFSLTINGRPQYARQALEASLRRLGIEVIDLWYLHYPDPAVPIEETVGAMAGAVRAGKVRYLGLSNVTADDVRRAHEVHSISAVQNEYSLWRREDERRLFPTLRALGIGYVPWSPLGGGFLTGTVRELGANDFRNRNPRFSQENLGANRDRFAPLADLARSMGITPAQLALAWVLHQGQDIAPIPGTRRPERIDENVAAAGIRLGQDLLARIDALAPPGWAAGRPLLD
jgi:aryl-alcohol dehydrogenase-like predicted oxidoreductase